MRKVVVFIGAILAALILAVRRRAFSAMGKRATHYG